MINESIKVSVGMPVYNGAAWLRSAAEAILTQTHADLELIISDNASTDASRDIAEQLAREDDRVRYYRCAKNSGATANYNAVLHCSTGDYFKWASCNDYCKPEFLERCLAVLQADSTVVVAYPQTCLFEHDIDSIEPYDDNLHLMWDDPYRRFTEFFRRVRLNNVLNGVIRKSALMQTALMRPYYASDTCLMAELTLHGKFYEVPERLFYRRMDSTSATRMKSTVEVVRHWNPDLRPVQFSVTRAIIQQFASLLRAPLDFKVRLRLAGFLTRQTIWARKTIWDEIVDSGRHYSRLTRHNHKV